LCGHVFTRTQRYGLDFLYFQCGVLSVSNRRLAKVFQYRVWPATEQRQRFHSLVLQQLRPSVYESAELALPTTSVLFTARQYAYAGQCIWRRPHPQLSGCHPAFGPVTRRLAMERTQQFILALTNSPCL